MLDIISIHEKFQATFFFSITQIFNRTKASVVESTLGETYWQLRHNKKPEAAMQDERVS